MENVVFTIKKKYSIVEKIDRWKIFTPINTIVVWYLLILLLGALLLMLPWSTNEGRIGFTDALFTSTSATTVTGLAVKETGSYFTFFGQLVICLLIQIGGVGYMALFGFFLLSGQQDVSFEQRMLLRETINSPTVKGIRKMARRIFFFIVLIEIFGALILSYHWWSEYSAKALWYGLFQSIAAFNNAGFDILATGAFESLGKYATDITVNMVVAWLIIMGGIGFYVLSDIYRVLRGRKDKISYQTRVVCVTTFVLLILGTILFLVMEYNNPITLGKYSIGEKVLISFFNSVTPRTAGFSTVPVANFFPLTLLLIMVLMFIGASPGGTGGGIKTTTLAVFWGYIKKCIMERDHINVLSHRISNERLNKAVAISSLSLALIAIVSSIIILVDSKPLLEAAFETTSAFGTVGLSMGITRSLGTFAKYLIMITMFAGKVGVLTLALFFSKERKEVELVLPSGELTM